MTVLIGAAFVIHHHEESHYLAGGSDSYSVQENAQTGENASESFVRNRNIPEPAGQAAGSDPQ